MIQDEPDVDGLTQALKEFPAERRLHALIAVCLELGARGVYERERQQRVRRLEQKAASDRRRRKAGKKR